MISWKPEPSSNSGPEVLCAAPAVISPPNMEVSIYMCSILLPSEEESVWLLGHRQIFVIRRKQEIGSTVNDHSNTSQQRTGGENKEKGRKVELSPRQTRKQTYSH